MRVSTDHSSQTEQDYSISRLHKEIFQHGKLRLEQYLNLKNKFENLGISMAFVCLRESP